MRTWFYSHFQDPVEETPYDSRDGGYQYIHGGPYEAEEELGSHFAGLIPDDVIEELSDELDGESSEWAGRSDPSDYDLSDYDKYALQTIGPASGHIYTFNASVDSILKLIGVRVDAAEQQFFLRLLFASVITALETYLADLFISSIKGNSRALRKFVESFHGFQTGRLKTRDIFKEFEQLEHRVTSMLVGKMIWHRLDPVAKIFRDTFGVDFTQAPVLSELLRDIEIRHDIIHRSGKKKDGTERALTDEDIHKLIGRCVALVQSIETQRGNFTAIV